ncbi:CoA transferase [Actinomycetospora endophytica]|uniref:CoA transferase n=1 Tax=Actinomycetospora endophytica TaxID=2291215 RepID=A0ABS8PB47_9PSEU|nr:CoA transferase [Actinomycetospora endophytica]
MVHGTDGAPPMPATTWADIGGGSYPAVVNILLALLRRHRTGVGAHLDVAMAENLLTFVYWGVAGGAAGQWPRDLADAVADEQVVARGVLAHQVTTTGRGATLPAVPLPIAGALRPSASDLPEPPALPIAEEAR